MTPSTGDVPDDGDVIEFSEVPAGSLLKAGVRYRVEHKAGDREYLLVDVASGHAGRVMAHMLKEATWRASTEGRPASADPSSDAKPLSSEPPPPKGEGLLNLEPLPATPPVSQ